MKKIGKGKILADVKRQKKKKESVASRYDKLKTWQPNINPNMNNHRYLPKDFIFEPLSLTAKSLYPVLCYLADFKDPGKAFQESQANIGRMAGISNSQTVKKAITELCEAGYCKAEYIRGERQYYVYRVEFVRIDEGTVSDKQLRKGTFYRFNTCIIESGVWAELKPRQQVFYQALRSRAVIDPDEEQAWHDLKMEMGIDHIPYKDFYAQRKHEIFMGSVPQLCEEAGMSSVNMKTTVIKPLEKYRLVKQLDAAYYSVIQVNLNPKIKG